MREFVKEATTPGAYTRRLAVNYKGREGLTVYGVLPWLFTVTAGCRPTDHRRLPARPPRINYEICVLQTLRDRLRCKEIWVTGADRFGNPDDDLPTDFELRREAIAHDPQAFTGDFKAEMTEGLACLGPPAAPQRDRAPRPPTPHPIVVSPLEPQPELPNLEH